MMSTPTIPAATYSEVMRGRRSVRVYDPSVTIDRSEIEAILEEATLAPSSANLQPWRFLVIDDRELKASIHPIANHQDQVLEAPVLIAVLGDLDCVEHVEEIY